MATSKRCLGHGTLITVALLAAETVFIMVFLAIRNSGLYPVVFGDEWLYSLASRLTPIAESRIPSYLFLLLFKSTSHCGAGFLECARIINACLFALSLPFIYLVSRQYASRGISLFISLMAVLGPINSYTAYFMPEAMYFFAFWVFAWFVLSNTDRTPPIFGGGAGFALGIMALIKIHAIFLFPAFVLFLLLAWLFRSGEVTTKHTAYSIAYAICGFCLARLVLGYLIAGKSGLSLIGEFYGPHAAAALDASRLIHTLQLAKHSLFGHVLALSMLFAVPLAIMASVTRQINNANREHTSLKSIQIFSLAFVTPLLLIVSFWTAHLAGAAPDQTIGRLHMRYYNFMFPLFFILAAAHASSPTVRQENPRKAWIPALPVALLAAYALAVMVKTYSPNFVDSPELRGITFNATALSFLGALGIISLIAWSIRGQWGASLYVLVFLPLAVVTSGYFVTKELRQRLVRDVYDDAGIFARLYLGEDSSNLVIASSNPPGLFRTLFYVDNPRASIMGLAPGSPLELSQIPRGKAWALVIGDHQLIGVPRYQISIGDYSLLKLFVDDVVDFRNKTWPGLFAKARGLSQPEGFGRWSDADEVELIFHYPLPETFRLSVTARAFGPNVYRPFKISVGQQEQTFRLGPSMQKLAFTFESNGSENIVRIRIPNPVSPKELGLSVDDRRLGIGLQQVRIEELASNSGRHSKSYR